MTHPLQVTPDLIDHYVLMVRSVLETDAQHVLEIGTSRGDSARIFAKGLELTGGRLSTLDSASPEGDWPQQFLELYPKTIFLVGDSLLFPWDQSIDVLFIDSSHVYPDTVEELDRYGIWVREGGRILLHDIYHEVPQTGTTPPREGDRWPVMRSIAQWLNKKQLSCILHPGKWGMAEITVTKALR